MSKMAAEHRRINAPPPAFPMPGQRRGCSTQLRTIAARPPFGPSQFEISQSQRYYADLGRWVGAVVADCLVGWDVRGADVLAIFKGYGTERGAVSQKVTMGQAGKVSFAQTPGDGSLAGAEPLAAAAFFEAAVAHYATVGAQASI